MAVLTLVYVYSERQNALDTQQRFINTAEDNGQLIETLINAKKDKVMLIALSLSHDSAIKNSLKNKQPNDIDFTHYVQQVADYAALKNVWVQLIDKQGISLYRSWSNKRGDEIIAKRHDLQAMFKKPRIMQTISVGMFDLTFKTMVPIYDGGEFLGVFEVLAKFNSIADKLSEKKINTVILVDEKYHTQLKSPFTKRFLRQNYIANLDAREDLLYLLDQNNMQRISQKQRYLILQEQKWFVSFKTLYGADNEPLATFYLFQPLEPILATAYKPSAQIYIYLTAAYLLLVMLYLWQRAYRRSIQQLSFNRSLQSEVKNKEQALQYQSYFWQSIIDGLDHTVMVVNPDLTIELKNRAAKHYQFGDFDPDGQVICNAEVFNIDQPCEDDFRICPLKKCFSTAKTASIVQKVITPDGDKRYFEFTSTPLFDDYGNVAQVIEIGHDITHYLKARTKLQSQKKELDFMAYYDSLTHLPNRILFLDRLQQSLEHARRTKKIVAVLFIDLDRFKEINDTYGHKFGDDVIIACAERLKSLLNEADTVARLSSDEFAVVIDDLTRSEQLLPLVQNLLKVMAEPIKLDQKSFYMTASIGISLSTTDGVNAPELMKNADTAMYQVKQAGRNSYAFYDPQMTAIAVKRVQIEEKLRVALQKRQFILHYQPQFDIKSGELTGFEALVRWRHPQDGLVPPLDFIPLAEESGLIVQIGQQIMLDAMLAAVKWRNLGLSEQRIAINVSAKQFQDAQLLEMVEDSLMATGCQPEWIELEITESSVMIDQQYTVNVLNALKTMGITISIDDFGTGYSSLAELKRMPINKLKIDQSFIRTLPDDREDCEITRAIISMGNSLGLDLIAEGVETEQQSQFLLENGCAKAQGYLFSRPLDEKAVEALLDSLNPPS